MVDAARARKLAVRIHEIVAETLRTGVKDPRLGMVTVTDAKVTADLHDATVFYTVYGDDADRAATAAALESAKGVLRTAVGRQTGVRFTPTLTFEADVIPDNARHIDELLAEARRADEEVQRRAAGAQFAGEADPYRVPNGGLEEDPSDGTPGGTDGGADDTAVGGPDDTADAPDGTAAVDATSGVTEDIADGGPGERAGAAPPERRDPDLGHDVEPREMVGGPPGGPAGGAGTAPSGGAGTAPAGRESRR
jgi:ribosome-binding factor A